MLSQARLRALVSYDPATGLFTRLTASGTAHAGDKVGWTEPNGYKRASLDGVKVWLHRAAWLYVTGEAPDYVDHRNGDKGDNRFTNLRSTTQSVNMQNQRKARSNNTSGLLGVSWHRGAKKFMAEIRLGNTREYLGLHETAEAAHATYVRAKRRLHEGCTI